jgi:hypothetical protein
MAVIHKKIWPDMFDTDKDLHLDFRLADFELKEGDTLAFEEWDPKTKAYTGRSYKKHVSSVFKCNSPTKYWSAEKLKKHGLYLMEFEN